MIRVSILSTILSICLPCLAGDNCDILTQHLRNIHNRVHDTNSIECDISYIYTQQPGLLDAETRREGKLYYQKDKKGEVLLIAFDTVSYDGSDPQPEKLVYRFDGIWLVRMDRKLKKIDYYQQAPAQNPLDVFRFISHNFPIVGFADIDFIREQFDLALKKEPEKDSNYFIIQMLTKKDSAYRDDYLSIDLYADKCLALPVRFVAEAANEDLYDIRLEDVKLNKKLKNAVFLIEKPDNFIENRHRLKENGKVK